MLVSLAKVFFDVALIGYCFWRACKGTGDPDDVNSDENDRVESQAKHIFFIINIVAAVIEVGLLSWAMATNGVEDPDPKKDAAVQKGIKLTWQLLLIMELDMLLDGIAGLLFERDPVFVHLWNCI